MTLSKDNHMKHYYIMYMHYTLTRKYIILQPIKSYESLSHIVTSLSYRPDLSLYPHHHSIPTTIQSNFSTNIISTLPIYQTSNEIIQQNKIICNNNKNMRIDGTMAASFFCRKNLDANSDSSTIISPIKI